MITLSKLSTRKKATLRDRLWTKAPNRGILMLAWEMRCHLLIARILATLPGMADMVLPNGDTSADTIEGWRDNLMRVRRMEEGV